MITQHRTQRRASFLAGLLIAMLLLSSLGISQTRAQPLPSTGPSAADLLIYGDALAAGWEDWSWDSAVNLASAAVVQQGTAAAAITYQAAYAGFSVRTPSPVSASGYTAIAFGVYGAAGGSQLDVFTQATDEGSPSTSYSLTAPAGVWTSVTVPLTSLGSPATIARISIQDGSGAAQPTIYVDNLRLVGSSGGGGFPDPTPDRELTFSRSMAGVAIAPSGRLYASSWRESKIYSWAKAANANNPASSADMIFGTAMDPEHANPATRCGAPSATSFCGPEGIAVDQSGNLYVAATYHNRVLVFLNPETDADPQTADLVIEGMLDAPRGLALDTSGNLYVVDEFHYRVLVFNQPLTTDSVPDVIIGGTQGGGNNQFSLPLGVAVSSAGHVYVTDLFNERVMRFNPPLTTGMSASQVYSGFDAPHDLALDQAGNLYVADVFDADHALPNPPDSSSSRVAVIATPLSNTAVSYELPNVAYPLGMDFDAAGNLYVALCIGPYPCNGGGKLLVFNAPAAQPGTIALQVNAVADQRPISPYIYGMNSYGLDAATFSTLAQQLRLPLQRWGGNITTRYNWKNDMANHGSDWYFENIPEENPSPATGNAADHFVARGETSSTESLITIPMIGYVSKNRTTPNGAYDCSFSVTKYNYTPAPLYPGGAATDPDNPDSAHCGTGKRSNGTLVTGNDPADTSIQVGPAYMQDWVRHLIAKFGTAASGGVRFYNLDNEPGLWHETHRDVHPLHPSYAELTNLGKQYAAAIKAVDPAALTLGPVQDGWSRYFYSSYTDDPDPVAQADRDAHNGTPFVAWYLQQMRAYEQQQGTRLLDYFDLHYYPQADGVSLSPAGNAATQALRLRSTRALWDPTYVDESWIPSTGEATAVNGVGVNGAVQLIPRMRDWVNDFYPGTKLAISEYNWGALDHINGALAQADVLGIFGREGVDMATLWAPPTPTQPGAFAFRMYRNYDGQGGQFGDTSVRATSANQGQLAIYAARRKSDGALTLMIINKTGGALTSTVGLTSFTPSGNAKVYCYSASSLGSIVHQADQAVSASGFTATFPANSITLMVLPSADGPLTEYQVFVPLLRR